jgi:hypothetical protein
VTRHRALATSQPDAADLAGSMSSPTLAHSTTPMASAASVTPRQATDARPPTRRPRPPNSSRYSEVRSLPGITRSSTTRSSISDTALLIAARQWEPPSLDLVNVNPARVKDRFLGGDKAFALDRAWCANATHIMPSLPRVYRDERDFLRRAVRFAKRKRRIHRFIVVGAGLPYARPVHDDVLPHPRGQVVYADHDEYVTAHLDLFVAERCQIASIRGDILVPGTILLDDNVQLLLRNGTPVCMVLNGVLETIADTGEATAALQCFTERLPSGSLVIATHATVDGLDTGDSADVALAKQRRQLCETYGATTYRPPRHLRTAGELRDILSDLKLVQPGITYTSDWHNLRSARGLRPAESLCLAAVAEVRRSQRATIAVGRRPGRG